VGGKGIKNVMFLVLSGVDFKLTYSNKIFNVLFLPDNMPLARFITDFTLSRGVLLSQTPK